ncbi:MAG: hypothetical protein ACOX52_16185 [Verrucomicrobiota bacterium]
MEPTHPDRLVENATAPSAGGFPGPDGEVRLRMRLPFRTGSSGRAVPKGQWRSKIGVAIGLGIEKTRDGIPTRETG